MKKSLLLLSLAALAIPSVAQEPQTLFDDDFSWLAPWAKQGDNDGVAAGDHIGTNQTATGKTKVYCPQITTGMLTIGEESVTAKSAMENKGYVFLYHVCPQYTGTDAETSSTYLQSYWTNGNPKADGAEIVGAYIKFGKKNFTSGLQIPAIDFSNVDTEVTVSFNWCPMKDKVTEGSYDKTHLAVIVENDGVEVAYDAPFTDFSDGDKPFAWYPVDVKLTGAKLTKDTKISIRPKDYTKDGVNYYLWPLAEKDKVYRYFLRGVKVTAAGSSAVDEIATDTNAPVEYYNLQGVKVANPSAGIYIVKQGNKISKQVIR